MLQCRSERYFECFRPTYALESGVDRIYNPELSNTDQVTRRYTQPRKRYNFSCCISLRVVVGTVLLKAHGINSRQRRSVKTASSNKAYTLRGTLVTRLR